MAQSGLDLSTGFDFSSSGNYDGDLPIDWAPRRFWLDPGETKYVVFLDDDPQNILEHEVKIGDFYYNRFVCREVLNEECYFCNEVQTENWEGEMVDETPYNLWALTIIDQTGYIDDDGEEHRNIKSILPMKRSSAKKIAGKRDEYNGLRGHQFKVNRTTKQDQRIGEEWIEQGEFDVETEFEDSEPYDYSEIITVYDYDEQKEKYSQSNSVEEVIEEADIDGDEQSSESDDFFDDKSSDEESDSEETTSSDSSDDQTEQTEIDEADEEEDEDLVKY